MRQRVHQLHHQRVSAVQHLGGLASAGLLASGKSCGALHVHTSQRRGHRAADLPVQIPSARAATDLGSNLSDHFPACLCRASDKCQREKRKTINGDDLLWAMSTLGFEDYIEPLKLYLHKYREVQC